MLAAEDHGLQDLEAGDAARGRVDVQLEALHARGVLERSAARAAVGQRPPVLALGVIEDVRKVPQPAVVCAGSAAHVERGTVERQPIDEFGRGDG